MENKCEDYNMSTGNWEITGNCCTISTYLKEGPGYLLWWKRDKVKQLLKQRRWKDKYRGSFCFVFVLTLELRNLRGTTNTHWQMTSANSDHSALAVLSSGVAAADFPLKSEKLHSAADQCFQVRFHKELYKPGNRCWAAKKCQVLKAETLF